LRKEEAHTSGSDGDNLRMQGTSTPLHSLLI
jgi:hypothetical protein